MKNKCYICGRELADGTDCCPHFEHIIPNALGGHLTCNTILCEKCGGDYSKGDSCFVALFDCFVHHIEHQMLFDRKHGGVKVKGSYYDGDKKVDIIVDEKAATPQRPIIKEDDDPVKIIANRKVAKQLVEKYKNAGKDVKVIENLYGGLALYFSEEKASFNDYFKEGFIKIAIEYALYKGISREQLNVALTIHDDNSASVNFDNIPVFPFVPMDSFNNVYENHRQVLENNYPSHSIILFNDGLSLWCYIDLFSTFQYYVLLDDNYIGDKLYECYCQPLFAQREQYMYSREELESFDMRDLHIVVCEMGIDYHDKPIAKIIDEIIEVQSNKVTKRVYNDLVLPDVVIIESCYKEDCFEEDGEAIDQDIAEEIKANSSTESYRHILSKKVDGEMKRYSYPIQCHWLAGEGIDSVREYTYKKFQQLEIFSNNLYLQKQVDNYWYNKNKNK